METPFKIDVRLHCCGRFEYINGKSQYTGGAVVLLNDIWSSKLSYYMIVTEAKKVVGHDVSVFIWFRKHGLTMGLGRTIILGDRDMVDVLKSRDKDNRVDLYVTTRVIPYANVPIPNSSNPMFIVEDTTTSKIGLSTKPKPKVKPIPTTPLRKSPRHKQPTPFEEHLASQPVNIQPLQIILPPSNLPPSKLPIRRAGVKQGQGKEAEVGESVTGQTVEGRSVETEGEAEVGESVEVEVARFVGGEAVLGKGKGKKAAVTKNGKKKKVNQKGTKKTVKRKGKKKDLHNKGKSVIDEEQLEEDFDVSEESDIEVSDFEADEEDLVAEDVFEVQVEKGNGKDFVAGLEEEEGESDELRSLNGSEDEEDGYNIFNPDIDLKRKVQLDVGLKFSAVEVLRQALRVHAIENRYDYYFLHNGSKKVRTYCRYKCKCEWDKVRAKIRCVCKKFLCPFRIYATKKTSEDYIVIRTMNLNHSCSSKGYNKKLSSQYLAEKYLEEWRENPTWLLSVFVRRVYRDMGINISYSQAWLARARAKLMLYGDGDDEYGRVWEYAAALIKYNPGSTAIVVVNSVQNPPPLFQRMYVCLKACKVGFLVGCRPFIGVDGCHLKGAYPGMCLVAVAMDGNNNIYPVAWAVVEVENRDTWTWFLTLLMEDLEKEDGQGLTIMSDRQKGLLEAFNTVTPKAEIRFCVRHIWANFKLQFSGPVYKETFWKAAKSTTVAEFNRELERIKSLNPKAHEYLTSIPAKHWSRHAFSTTSKTNILLNNLCESFNAVLKEARDKPIITLMEWIRRYVMKRHYDKRVGVVSYEERFMPFVTKYLNWAGSEARLCTFVHSISGEYEVTHRGFQRAVHLGNRTCSCKTWELTGLPCPHAIVCIIEEREEVLDYVNEAYTKATYVRCFEHAIAAMPGYQEWEKVGQVAPLPPPFKKLPGRPKLKKRRREAGEESSKASKKLRQTRACGKCGGIGHNVKTCKNPAMTREKQNVKTTRSTSTTTWSIKVREAVARRAAKGQHDAVVIQGNCGPNGSQHLQHQESRASASSAPPAQNSRRKLGFED